MKSASPKGSAGMSLASDTSERSELDDVDGDALLLRLAAHDEIWRKAASDFSRTSIFGGQFTARSRPEEWLDRQRSHNNYPLILRGH